MKERTNFGIANAMLRAKYQVSQREMAQCMAVSASYLSAVELGTKPLAKHFLNASMKYWADMGEQHTHDLRDAALLDYDQGHMHCPYPLDGDDGTVMCCVSHGHCGCIEKRRFLKVVP